MHPSKVFRDLKSYGFWYTYWNLCDDGMSPLSALWLIWVAWNAGNHVQRLHDEARWLHDEARFDD